MDDEPQDIATRLVRLALAGGSLGLIVVGTFGGDGLSWTIATAVFATMTVVSLALAEAAALLRWQDRRRGRQG